MRCRRVMLGLRRRRSSGLFQEYARASGVAHREPAPYPRASLPDWTTLGIFLYSELLKQSARHDEGCLVYYFRNKDQDEVDFVVEDPQGRVLGVEVKAAATVNAADFKGLRKLAAVCGGESRFGVVLYDGEQVIRSETGWPLRRFRVCEASSGRFAQHLALIRTIRRRSAGSCRAR